MNQNKKDQGTMWTMLEDIFSVQLRLFFLNKQILKIPKEILILQQRVR